MIRYIILLTLLGVLTGCQSSEPETSQEPTWKVAFDQKSKQAFAVDSTASLPATNPASPKSQLLPAWYCETCQKWYPVPPLEQINRSQGAGVCPKDGKALTPNGPRPEKEIALPTGRTE